MSRKHLRAMTSLLLAFIMVIGLSTGAYARSEPLDNGLKELVGSLTEKQIETIWKQHDSRGPAGLVSFDSEYALSGGDEPVSVIVLFQHQPAVTERLQEAVVHNRLISLDEARKLVEEDHRSFANSVKALMQGKGSYEITATYKIALNGVAMTLPSSKVAELASLSSVYAVYPDEIITLDPSERDSAATAGDNSGLAAGRDIMNVDALHDLGFKGKGVSVCVIDTGVDYNHPDLAGAFGTSNPAGTTTDKDLINGKFYGRNFHPSVSDYPYYPERGDNDPMETTMEGWKATNYREINGDYFYTYHGTHVSGTVAGRGVNNPGGGVSALGVAPEATLFVYRALGPYGAGPTSSIAAAIEFTDTDKPDVVNMSLGGSVNSPVDVMALAVSNICLKNPEMVFVLAAGNFGGYGYYTLGSPATSSTAITVANASAPVFSFTIDMDCYPNPNVTISLGALYMDGDTTFEGYSPPPGWLTYNRIRNPRLRETKVGNYYCYDIVALPNLGGGDSPYGTGSREEFEAVKDKVAGSFVFLRRGNDFLETIALAKEYKAGAILLMTGLYESSELQYRGASDDYLPFFVMDGSYEEYVASLIKNKRQLVFFNYVEDTFPPDLHWSSSRGPVGMTFDIKPDIVGHGTEVLSTLPAFMSRSGAYGDAYGGMSGTSMAAPHVAGAAALLKNYSNKAWDAAQIKARLMNTARNLNTLADDYEHTMWYGFDYRTVYEQGAGYADVLAAAKANSYVDVEHNVFAYGEDGKINSDGVSRTGSFSFGLVDPTQRKAESRSLTGTIHNSGAAARTYRVSVVWNENQSEWDTNWTDKTLNHTTYGVTLTVPAGNITVPAGATADFTATMTTPATLSTTLDGSFEGYVVVTNTQNASEVYRLPFAVCVKPVTEPLRNGMYFLNRPAISTGADKQLSYSSYSDLYVQANAPAYLRFLVADPELYDGGDLAAGNWHSIIGELPIEGTLSGGSGWQFIPEVVTGMYNSLTWDADHRIVVGSKTIPFADGYYKIVIEAMSDTYHYYYYDMDLYVDNTPIEPVIDRLDTGGDYASYYVERGAAGVTLTGSAYDDGIDFMRENGINFDLWDQPGDPMPRVPDQSYNAILARVGSSYYRASVDPKSGRFSLTIPLNGLELPVKVTLYAIDKFSAIETTGRTLSVGLVSGYDVAGLSGRFTSGGSTYGYHGSNMTAVDFYIEEEGVPRMILSEEKLTLRPNQRADVRVLFNSAALAAGDFLTAAESGDPVTVKAAAEGNLLRLTAVRDGEAVVTATSKNGLRSACTVTVPLTVGDGLGFLTGGGAYIYYGAMKHMKTFKHIFEGYYYDSVIEYEDKTAPILWQVMGEEKNGGVGDGDLSLYSEYVLDATMFDNAMMEDGTPYYHSSLMRTYINGRNGQNGLANRIFSGAEYGAVPAVRNEVPLYGNSGVIIPDHSFVASGDKLYLPWVYNHYENGTYNIYWSAGKDLAESNSVVYEMPMAQTYKNPIIKGTMRNGVSAQYSFETALGLQPPTVECVYDNEFETEYKTTIPPVGWQVYFDHGIRPGVKLDMDSVVYAYEITEQGGLGKAKADGVYYPIDGKGTYYKLSVLGGNNGRSVGYFENLARSASVLKGENLTLSGVKLTAGADGFDMIAYKIVDQNGNLLRYGEFDKSAQTLEIQTGDLDAGDYMVYCWPQKNNEINSNEAGAVATVAVSVAGTGSAELTVGLSVSSIVSTLSAYLSVTVSGAPGGTVLTAYLEADGELLCATPVTDGACRMYIPAAPYVKEAETFRIVVTGEGCEGSRDITVVPYDTGIWKASVIPNSGGCLKIKFNERIASGTDFAKSVTIGGVSYDATVENGDTLVVKDVAYDGLASGTKIVISGVRYPALFPSYSFTFTVYR